MRSLITSITILAVVGLAVGVVSNAADVDVTVTPQIISVTVTDGDVDYGVLDTSDTNNTFDGSAAETQTITSVSNASTDVTIRSSDAYVTSNTTDWDLVGTAAADDFVHSYDINASASASWTVFPSDGTFDNTNTGTVVTLTNNGDTATLDLKIDMPTSITDTSAHSVDITVVASAT